MLEASWHNAEGKSQKVHISSNVLQNLQKIDFVRHKSRGFLIQEAKKQKFPALPINFLKNSQKTFS